MKGIEIEKKDIKKEIKDGGTFTISAHDIEMLSAEQLQIDGIIGLAKEDKIIKYYLLKVVMENFFNELEFEFTDIFASNGLLKEV